MHGKLKSLSLLLFLIIVFSCQTEQEVKPAKGKLSLSFSDNGNARTSEVFAPTAILITIKNSVGETVLDMQRLELYNFSGRFVTDNQEKLHLPVGTYQITDLLVVNAQNQVTHVVPKIGTPGANGMVDVLPHSLTINADEETLTTFVVTKVEGQPSEYGYASFEVVEGYPNNTQPTEKIKEYYIEGYYNDCQCFRIHWKYTFTYNNNNTLAQVDKYELDNLNGFKLRYREVFNYLQSQMVLKTFATSNNELTLHTTDEFNYFDGKLAFIKHTTAYSNDLAFTYVEKENNILTISRGMSIHKLVLDPVHGNVMQQILEMQNNPAVISSVSNSYSGVIDPLQFYNSFSFPYYSSKYLKTSMESNLSNEINLTNYSISTFPNSNLAHEVVAYSATNQNSIVGRKRFVYY